MATGGKNYVEDLIPIFGAKMNAETDFVIKNYRGLNNNVKGETYVKNAGTFSQVPWFYNESLPRKYITFINRIKSGHFQLKAHLTRMNISQAGECECGFSSEDLNHKVWHCPLIDNESRNKFLLDLSGMGIPINCDIQETVLREELLIQLRIIEFLISNEVFL